MLNPEKIEAMKAQLSTGVQVVSAPQLFETPASLAERAVDLADLEPGQIILEPSAGTGALIDAILSAGAEWQQIAICEINAQLCGLLSRKYRRVYPGDFLERTGWELGAPFDRVIMNPR